jgi:DnaJ-domain-containing protein 1
MSNFTRKIFEGARAGLNSLMEQISADDAPLSHVDEASLQAELALRQPARAGRPAPADNPLARMSGAGEEARRAREERARIRLERARAEQARRAAEEQRRRAAAEAEEQRRRAAAQEDAFRRVKEQAARPPPPGGPRAGAGGARAGAGGARAGAARSVFSSLGQDPKIAKYYKLLDLPYGADFDQVKAAYRKLMRRYHPDRHVQAPEKQKAATELSMQVTQAYNEIEAYLRKQGRI